MDNRLFLLPQGAFLGWIAPRLREIEVMIIYLYKNKCRLFERQVISFLRDEVSLTLVVCSKRCNFVQKCPVCIPV